MLGHTSKAVATGIPVIGLTPETTEPKFAVGLPLVKRLMEVVKVIAPVHTAPTTISPIQAQGRPLTRFVGIPGPVTTSPVAVTLAKVAHGVGIVDLQSFSD